MSEPQSTSPPEPSEGASAIITAASKLFAEQGFEAVSVAEIARVAGVGKATIFHHYPSKLALYEAVLESVRSDALWSLEDQDWNSGELEERIASYVERQVRHLEANREILRLVQRELHSPDKEDNMRRVARIFEEPFTRLVRLFREARVRGQTSPDVSPEVAAHLLMHAGVDFVCSRPVLVHMAGAGHTADVSEFARNVAAILTHGFAPRSTE